MCSITFSYSHDCQKKGKKYNIKKKFYEPNLTVEFFGFSPAGPKTKADPPDSQEYSKDKINTKSDMCEV